MLVRAAPRASRVASFAWSTLALALVAGVAVVACSSSSPSYASCDYVVTRCRTVCDYWCDGWGCYPACYDQCWDDCVAAPAPPAPPRGGGTIQAPPADGGAPDASAPAEAGVGRGVLCSPCASNDDCAAGALCVVRGGDAGAQGGFCGHACASGADCPKDFACTSIGASRQCLPTGDQCK